MMQQGVKTSRLAIVLGVFLVVIIAIAAATSIWVLRQQTIDDWRRQTNATALILAENVSQQMSSAYLALDTVTERIQAASGGDANRLCSNMASIQIHQLLVDKTGISPQIDVISVISDTGDLLNFSRQYPAPPLNIVERDYFKAQRDNPALGVFISEPIRNKINGKWTFYISRRLNGSAGEFIGLVVLGISTDYYSNFYQRVSLEGRASVTLLRNDFMILTRWPVRDDLMGKTNLTGMTYRVVHDTKNKSDVSINLAARFSEQGQTSPRMAAVRVVDNYPLIVNYTIEEALYLAEWRKTSMTVAAVAVGSMLAIILSFGLLVQLLRRREADLAITTELRRQADTANRAKSLLLDDMAQQQQALKDASDRLEAIFQHAAEGIVILDENGNVESFNRAAKHIYGYRAVDIIGRPGDILVPPSQPNLMQIAMDSSDFADTGQIYVEADRLRQDGSLFPAELSMGQFYLSGQRKLIVIIRDITERRKMERVKSEFISTVSHELRTPLTSIRGALGLLAGGVAGSMPAKAQSLVSMAYQNSERLTRLINDLLDVQKIEAGKMDFNFSMLPVQAILQAAVDANQTFGQRLGVAIVLLEPIPDVAVLVDPDRFQQVIANLLSNACKYSFKGGSVIVQARLIAEHKIRMEVIDQGDGIAEEFRERIFQKFSQADSSDTRAKEGTGLGLSIAQAIVLQMQGVIGYHSVVGQGSTFFIDLPVYPMPG